MFDEPVEAWAHGPVVDEVYQTYKVHGYGNIPRPRRQPNFATQEVTVLQGVMATYGEHSGKFLEDLTHEEEPWRSTWGDRAPTSRSRQQIPLPVMKQFYRKLYERRSDPDMKVDLDHMRLEPLREGVRPLLPRPEGDDWEPDTEFLADAAASQISIGRGTGRGRLEAARG